MKKKRIIRKKRSAKQLANDKRLGRMAKKRAADARKGNPHRKKNRKVAKRKKRKNPSALRTAQKGIQRATNPKSSDFIIFKYKSSKVSFYNGNNWTSDKRKAIVFQSQKSAIPTARKLVAHLSHYDPMRVGIINRTSTSAEIKTKLMGKT